MCGIIVDAVILFAVMRLLLGDDAPDFYVVVLVALGIAIANLICGLGMMAALGPVGEWLAIPVVVVVDGFILMYFCHLTLRDAAIAVGTLAAAHVAMGILFATLV